MNSSARRKLNGWKAIAAYFGRDRKTVSRWARERDLPIHEIPGGSIRSVFAYEDELAAWERRDNATPDADSPSPVSATPPPRRFHLALPRRRRTLLLWSVLPLFVIGAATVPTLTAFRNSSAPTVMVPAAQSLPDDRAAAADYIAARTAWGRRTDQDLKNAIRLYTRAIDRAPDFAPARAGLAEAWLIIREYGDVGDARAYGAARIAARKALSLDPDLPSAHRAIGFIHYWWDNDPDNAIASFRRAIAQDPADAQTLFWFANILADLGQAAAAERYYQRAMLLHPGSRPIEVEHACARWQAGDDAAARRLLLELKGRYPGDATILNCLTWLYIGVGDIRAYVDAFAGLARLRREPDLLALSEKLTAAYAADPATAHRVLIADARREIAIGTRRTREVPAFHASSMGDRASLLALMREAAHLGERWNSSGITRRIAARWKTDREILPLLKRLEVMRPVDNSL